MQNSLMLRYGASKHVLQLLAAGGAGAVIGLTVFTIDHVTGRNLYLIVGIIAGMAAALVQRRFWSATRLTELTITVPQLSELKFVVNNEARQVAWQLYIEAATRVSTQSMGDDSGSIREALSSLYGLFATTRDILKASRPSVPASSGPTVEHLAVTMLNHHLRPFLSKWHPRLRDFERAHPDCNESAWPDNHACRRELTQVQKSMVDFALAFARLAGVYNAQMTIMAAD